MPQNVRLFGALRRLAHNLRHGLGSQLAVATASLATVGSIASSVGGATQSDAALYKSDAAIRRSESASQWAYDQSESTKENLSELAAELVPNARKAHIQEEAWR